MARNSNKTTTVEATIHNFQLIQAIRKMINDNDNFDFLFWSIDDAETLENAARLIREGYGKVRDRTLEQEPPCKPEP